MAKITITFEDEADGGVHIVGDPPLEEIGKLAMRPDQMTSAHGYAMACWGIIIQQSRIGTIDLAKRSTKQ